MAPPSSARPVIGRLGPVTRLAAWYVTGPVGHFVAGALDAGALFARLAWQRVRSRPPGAGPG
jgi:hypothetical protein